jgi:hypothetical protein
VVLKATTLNLPVRGRREIGICKPPVDPADEVAIGDISDEEKQAVGQLVEPAMRIRLDNITELRELCGGPGRVYGRDHRQRSARRRWRPAGDLSAGGSA